MHQDILMILSKNPTMNKMKAKVILHLSLLLQMRYISIEIFSRAREEEVEMELIAIHNLDLMHQGNNY